MGVRWFFQNSIEKLSDTWKYKVGVSTYYNTLPRWSKFCVYIVYSKVGWEQPLRFEKEITQPAVESEEKFIHPKIILLDCPFSINNS